MSGWINCAKTSWMWVSLFYWTATVLISPVNAICADLLTLRRWRTAVLRDPATSLWRWVRSTRLIQSCSLQLLTALKCSTPPSSQSFRSHKLCSISVSCPLPVLGTSQMLPWFSLSVREIEKPGAEVKPGDGWSNNTGVLLHHATLTSRNSSLLHHNCPFFLRKLQ